MAARSMRITTYFRVEFRRRPPTPNVDFRSIEYADDVDGGGGHGGFGDFMASGKTAIARSRRYKGARPQRQTREAMFVETD